MGKPVQTFEFLERAIRSAVGKEGGVGEAVAYVLARFAQDDETLDKMSRKGWVAHVNGLVSGGRALAGMASESAITPGQRPVRSGRLAAGGWKRERDILTHVEYEGADGRFKRLIDFSLLDWQKMLQRATAVRDTAQAQIEVARVAIAAFGKSKKAVLTSELPAPLLSEIRNAADATWRKKAAA